MVDMMRLELLPVLVQAASHDTTRTSRSRIILLPALQDWAAPAFQVPASQVACQCRAVVRSLLAAQGLVGDTGWQASRRQERSTTRPGIFVLANNGLTAGGTYLGPIL